MVRLFKHYVPHAVLLLGLLDFLLLLCAAEGGWILRAHQIGMDVGQVYDRIGPLLSFAVALQVAMLAVGVYGVDATQSIRFATARLLVAISLGVIFLSVMHFLSPEMTLWRSNSLYAMALSFILLITLRLVLASMIGGEAFKRRLIVLGAGARADRIRQLEEQRGAGFLVVGYIAMNDGPQLIEESINRNAIHNLAKFVVRLNASEVVLALEERRNALPLSDLLRIKTTGVHVNDLSTFLERETGRVDLDSVNPSWLIFSDGFSAGRRISSFAKRLFDILASFILLALTSPVVAVAAILVKMDSKGPAFYRQERVGLFGQDFTIVKLRTMRTDAEVDGHAVWAEKDDPRITRLGYWLRKLRIDELPQTWTVLKGEMSFVGPRPERRHFVEDLEQHLRYYAERHMVKPGITGWAQINYPYGASVEDSRNKLEYDLYYAKNYTPFLDLLILLQTVRVILWPSGLVDCLMGDVLSFIGDWGHALAAASYAALALWVARHRAGTIEQRLMATGLLLTALWALGISVQGTAQPMLGLAEGIRNLAWLSFMFVLLHRAEADDGAARRSGAVTVIYGLLAALLCLQAGVDVLAETLTNQRAVAASVHASVVLRLIVGIGALLLAHNLYLVATPEGRARLKLPLAALAAMWTYDLNLYTIAWLENGDPAGQVRLLYAVRGLAMTALVPVLWLGVYRADRWTLRLSRAATFQSLSLVAIGAYLVAMALMASIFDLVAGPGARLFEVGMILALSAAAIGLLPSRSFRAWLKVTVAKHFFQHRYDYRTEWMRFAATLGRPGAHGAPLHERVMQAVADITDSPAGLLLLRDDSGALVMQSAWNWPKIVAPPVAMSAADAAQLEASGWIFDIQAWRVRTEGDKAPFAPPDWMIAERAAWALVPLIHFDRLTGAILLARPRFDRRPDWEDFDMLRAAGRQAASYISEAQGQAALSDAHRFEEFNRRFAFIMHDIKNLVSQLSLVVRNAERHAGNPEFLADMVLTLKDSVGKMNDLLARLSQHHSGRIEAPRAMALRPVVDTVLRAKRGAHPILVSGDVGADAFADPARVEQILLHLVQNAIDASPADRPVTLGLGQRVSGELIVEVIDAGAGMSADFIAHELFKPFRSSKAGGFGIGAFEARTLAQAMGARIEVQSREGEGSRFTLVLPAARNPQHMPKPIIEKAA